MGTPTIEEILARVEGIRKQGNGYLAKCPAHDDRNPSLSIKAGDNGRVLVHCHAGCTYEAVMSALGMTRASGGAKPKKEARVAARYEYTDEDGKTLFRVVRKEPKAFFQESPDGKAGWKKSMAGVRLVPFRLPSVIQAVEKGETVFIAEGEKDVLALEGYGVTATCNPGGAQKWQPEFSRHLTGADVVIVVDKDEAGAKHCRSVRSSLRGVANSVKCVEAKSGKDAFDHLSAGYGLDDFVPWKQAGPEEPLWEVLDDVEQYIRRYVVFSSVHEPAAITLWIALTHIYELFDLCPVLSITSAEKRSGKSRVLDILEGLVNNAWRIVDPSEAVLFRKIGQGPITLLWDEVDAVFGGPKTPGNEGIRGLLNAGIDRRAVVPRCVGKNQDIEEFKVFCPKALAGIGRLPDTVADRSIAIRMVRKRPGQEQVQRVRQRVLVRETEAIRQRLVRTLDNADVPASFEDMPEELSDRATDCWEPLMAIASAASEEWLRKARAAAIALGTMEVEDDSLGIRALMDTRRAFEEEGGDWMSSQRLVELLVGYEESPWADWNRSGLTKSGLARLLRPFGIRTQNKRQGAEVAKSYSRLAFLEVWERYLPSSTAQGSAAIPVAGATSLQWDDREPDLDLLGVNGVADRSGNEVAVAVGLTEVDDEMEVLG